MSQEHGPSDDVARVFTLRQLEEAVLRTDSDWLTGVKESPAVAAAAAASGDAAATGAGAAATSATLAHAIATGNYASVLRSTAGEFLLGAPRDEEPVVLGADSSFDDVVSLMRHRASELLGLGGHAEPADFCSDHVVVLRASNALWVAVAALNLYLQTNWVGPLLDDDIMSTVYPLAFVGLSDEVDTAESKDDGTSQVSMSVNTDGTIGTGAMNTGAGAGAGAGGDGTAAEDAGDADDGTPSVTITRTVLSPLQAMCVSALDVDGESFYEHADKPQLLLAATALLRVLSDTSGEGELAMCAARLPSASWWCARAAVAHFRSLPAQKAVASLWRLVTNSMRRAAAAFASDDVELVEENMARVAPPEELIVLEDGSIQEPVAPKAGMPQAADAPPPAKQDPLPRAKALHAGLMVEWAVAQRLFGRPDAASKSLMAAKNASGLCAQLTGAHGKKTKHQADDEVLMVLLAWSRPTEDDVAPTDADTDGDTAPAQAAHLRGVTLDSIDDENPLLEGTAYTDAAVNANMAVSLPPADQAMLLLWAADVKDHNPMHNLTTEEMRPYVDRVLLHPRNWMVHSMALLFRCRLEYSSHFTQQRATFQMQALVDQHTNELTMLQHTREIVEDSAPVQERLQHAHMLEFPLRWGLQRELGRCWVRMGGVKSALEIFTKLRMWRDVVSCYLALQKRKRAQRLVEELLAEKKTPGLLCLLGEVTNKPEPYLEAWKMSGEKHTGAMTALAHLYNRTGDTVNALKFAKAAVARNGIDTHTWFLVGVLSMKLGDLETGAHALSQVVQQDPEAGEAWVNLGSVQMQRNKPDQAFRALEQASRHLHTKWRVWANYVTVAVQVRNFAKAIYGMSILCELCPEPEHRIDLGALMRCVTAVASSIRYHATKNERAQADAAAAGDAATDTSSAGATGAGAGAGSSTGAGSGAGAGAGAVVDTSGPIMPTPPMVVEDEVEAPADGAEAKGAEEGDAGDDGERDVLDNMGTSVIHCKPRLEKLLRRLTQLVTAEPRLWSIVAYYKGVTGDRAGQIDCLQKQCRALRGNGAWFRDERRVGRLCDASCDLVEAYMEENTKQSLSRARMHAKGVLTKATETFPEHEQVARLAKLMADVETARAGL